MTLEAIKKSDNTVLPQTFPIIKFSTARVLQFITRRIKEKQSY